jgi:predicted GNAT superfamily acetyltransferase
MSCSNACLRTEAAAQYLRRLSPADADAIHDLQRDVTATLQEGFLRFKEEYEQAMYLDGTVGAAFGIFDGEKLSAMALVRIPSVEHPNHLEPLPRIMPKADWPLHTAILENAMVAPHARGRGYQRALVDARVAYARKAGMRWIGGGARVGNVVSWRNLLASGLAIVGLRVNGGNAFIGLLKSMEQDALRSNLTNRRLVPAHDTDAHLRALEAGYVGTQLTSYGFVVYQLYVP